MFTFLVFYGFIYCVFFQKNDGYLIVTSTTTTATVAIWAATARLFITIIVCHYGFTFYNVFFQRNIGQLIVTSTTTATTTATAVNVV